MSKTGEICALLLLIAPASLLSSCGDTNDPTSECTVVPDSLSFGPVIIGGNREQTLALINSGTATLEAMPRILSPDFELPGLDSADVLRVDPGDTISLTVSFAPSAPGERSGELIFEKGACSAIALSGHGESAVCFVEPVSLDFGNVTVGETLDRPVRIINGSAAMLETRPEIISTEFRHHASLRLQLAPGDTQTIMVSFTPRLGGQRNGLLTFTGGGCPELPLQGWGDLMACITEPSALEFGRVLYGERPIHSVRLTNAGTLPLEGTVPGGCGTAFVVEAGAGPYRLEPGESRDIQVRFQPPRSGTFVCDLSLGTSGCRDFHLTGTAANETWRIREDRSGDAPTIQAGVDSAETGDIVLVELGTYYENILLRGLDIVLKSEDGPERTIVDGSSMARSVFAIRRGETRATVIEGFTITGGVGSELDENGSSHLGGGIIIISSSPTIRGNIVRGNGSASTSREDRTSWGGGIYCGGRQVFGRTNPVIENNIIEDNRSNDNGGGIGGQVFGSPIITGNIIRGNTMAEEGDGGGIWLHSAYAGTVVRDNWIENNTAYDKGGGMTLYATSGASRIEVSGNVFINNLSRGILLDGRRSWGNGGALWLEGDSYAVFNNTFVKDQGSDVELGLGGEILATGAGSIIERNIIAFARLGGGISCYGGPPEIKNNIVWMNAGGNGTGLCSAWVGIDGNIEADPKFCNLDAGDVYLSADSPALSHPSGPIGARAVAGCSAKP